MPLMEDSFYLESQILSFMSELVNLSQPALSNLVFKIYELAFPEDFMKKWIMHIMHSCCKKLLALSLTSSYT